MKAGLSIIMTIRGHEPKAKQTVENARANAGCPVEIIAVYDGTELDTSMPVDQILGHKRPRGIGQSRHKGICEAKYATIMLIDAHMNFQPGFGQAIIDHHKVNQKDIACGKCIPAMQDLSAGAEQGYTAGRFSLMSEEPGGERWCLSGKWAPQEVGPIGCVFGACYSFRRTWYKKIGEPLALLSGWWGDEEYLSIASWLAGGRVYLLDYWVTHLFRDNPSFEWTRSDIMAPTINRQRLVDLFPGDTTAMEEWLALNPRTVDATFQNLYMADKMRPEVIASKKQWSRWEERVADFMDKWVDANAAPLEERLKSREDQRPWKKEQNQEQIPHTQERKYIKCPNCGQTNSFRVTRTLNVGNDIRRYGKCGNAHCKKRGVMVDRPTGQVMYWGRDAYQFG